VRRNAIFAAFLILAVVGLNAQAPTVNTVTLPTLNLAPIVADSAQMGVDVNGLLQQANGNFVIVQNSLNAQATAINDPNIGLAALNARLLKLEHVSQVKPVVTEDYTAIPSGPVTGAIKIGGIDFSSSIWQSVQGIGLEPASSGTGRTMTMPGTSHLYSVKAFCINPCTLTLTPAPIDTTDSAAIFQLGSSAQTFTTNWQQASGAVSVSVSNGGANLRLAQASYQ